MRFAELKNNINVCMCSQALKIEGTSFSVIQCTIKYIMQYSIQYLCKQYFTIIQQQSSDEPFHTTAQDLAGFWDMVLIQVDDVDRMFEELDRLRQNGWRTPEKNTPVCSSIVVMGTC